VPSSLYFLRGDVRDNDKLLNKFPTYLMDLLSPMGATGINLGTVRAQCASALEQIEDTLYHLITQVGVHTSCPTRFEAYIDITDSRDMNWPNVNNLSPLRLVRHQHLRSYLHELCARNMAPLRKFVMMENERGPTERTNLAQIPPSARTRLLQCAETVTLLCNANAFRPIFFKDDGNCRGAVFETPVARRVELSQEVQDWTEMSYGIKPEYFKFRSTKVPEDPSTRGNESTTPLSRVLAARLQNIVVVPLSYVEALATNKRTFLNYQRLADGVALPENENADIAFFGDLDYAKLSSGLSNEERKNLLVDVSRVLIRLYEIEWHFYLFTPKRLRSHATPLIWPSRDKLVRHLPKTDVGVSRFRLNEPLVRHIGTPLTNQPITTESKYKLSKSQIQLSELCTHYLRKIPDTHI
jgi:hypothetical protein